MCIMKKILFCLMLSFYAVFCSADDFIIKKDDHSKINKMSRNNLKERIGTVAKNGLDEAIELGQQLGVLHVHFSSINNSKNPEKDATKKLQFSCTLHRYAGQLQQHVASVQKTLGSALEKLIDDAKPFKKAEKNDLRSTCVLLDVVQKDLKNQSVRVVQLQKQFGITKGSTINLSLGQIKKVCEEVSRIAQSCHALHSKLLADTCLKCV